MSPPTRSACPGRYSPGHRYGAAQRIGSDFSPFWKFDVSRTGSPASSSFGHTPQHLGEHRTHLLTGEMGAEAEVRATAEGDVCVLLAGDVEGVGILEDFCRISVGGGVVHNDLVAPLDLLAAKFQGTGWPYGGSG